jgi:hypothetical protein
VFIFNLRNDVSFIGAEPSFETSGGVCSTLGFEFKNLFFMIGSIADFIFFVSDVVNVSLIVKSQISDHFFVVVLALFEVLNELGFGNVQDVSFRVGLVGLDGKSTHVCLHVHTYQNRKVQALMLEQFLEPSIIVKLVKFALYVTDGRKLIIINVNIIKGVDIRLSIELFVEYVRISTHGFQVSHMLRPLLVK